MYKKNKNPGGDFGGEAKFGAPPVALRRGLYEPWSMSGIA